MAPNLEALVVLLSLVGSVRLLLIRDNVVFRKMNEVNTGRSRWTLAIVHDLEPYDRILADLANRTRLVRNVSKEVMQKHFYSWQSQGFARTIIKLDREIEGVSRSRDALQDYFQEYKMLNGSRRTKRALLPFIGQMSSFLFGTVSESDLGAIRQNIRTLANGQQAIRHVTEQTLTMINASQVEILQNRQAIDDILTTVGTLDTRLVNVTRILSKAVNRLETFTQLYLRLDLVIEELKHRLRTIRFSIQHLHMELNMLSLGRLSPSTISPSELIAML